MTTNEHLLTLICEECAEVAQRATKALRFGLTEIQPEQAFSNAERIMVEFDDLCAAIQMCQERDLLPFSDRRRIDAKKKKVEHFLEYSTKCGTHQLSTPAQQGGET